MKIRNLIFLLPIILLSACGDADPSRIVLGTGNDLIELNDLQYQLPFNVQVTDVDGNPAQTSVTITLKNLQYFKGNYVAGADSWVPTINATCAAEDTNNNGILNAGEDINGNGQLDPTNPATISAHPTETPTFDATTGTLTTNNLGFGYFVVTYPKSEAYWVRIQITATIDSSGTENTETYERTLLATIDDLSDLTIIPPGGTEGKYGIANDCTNPN